LVVLGAVVSIVTTTLNVRVNTSGVGLALFLGAGIPVIADHRLITGNALSVRAVLSVDAQIAIIAIVGVVI